MLSILKKDIFYYQSIWSIGICFFNNPERKIDTASVNNPVLTCDCVNDADAVFVADPFIIKENDIWYMFFEIYEAGRKAGVIGLASSCDGCRWRYERVVLREEFHLSYPYVFKSGDRIYMMPETGKSGCVKVYEAVEFPYGWKCANNIISEALWDPSIFEFNNKWWLLAWCNRPDKDSLRLFCSDSLLEGWREHPKSPVVRNNPGTSRPAGRVIYENNKLIRFSQDYSEYYGKRVLGFEITRLTADDYFETEAGIVIENSNMKNTWNKDGMHTIDIRKMDDSSYIAAVDGFYYKRVNKIAERLKRLFLC